MRGEPNEYMLVDAHGWDVAGAKWAGVRAVFIAREGSTQVFIGARAGHGRRKPDGAGRRTRRLKVWAAEGKFLRAYGTGDAVTWQRRELSPYDPQQMNLLSESLLKWLPEGHLAHSIFNAVAGLDFGAFHARNDQDSPRNQPFHPARMVKALVYG